MEKQIETKADAAIDGFLDAEKFMELYPINWEGICETTVDMYLAGFSSAIKRKWEEGRK